MPALPAVFGGSPAFASASAVALKLAIVIGSGLLLANCAQQQAGRNLTSQERREIGSFPQGGRWGTASPRMVADGQDVPKGGGREQIGRSYVINGRRYTPHAKPTGYTVVGNASWYGAAFHGRKTANGEVYDRFGVSAAHPTMPLPSYARVTNMSNRRSIIVRVNDRGPYHGGRVIDLSQKTAELLEFRHLGTARVRVEYIGRAALAGSDDRRLIASLTTDGAPASVPGMSVPATMIATAPPLTTPRPVGGSVMPESQQQPVVQAAAQVAQAAPAAQPDVSEAISRAVRTAPRPPERPFDLATIPGAATPIAFAGSSPSAGAVRGVQPQRAAVAALYFAPPSAPPARFTNAHPLVKDLRPQQFVALQR
jgi:rare lipoprotein A